MNARSTVSCSHRGVARRRTRLFLRSLMESSGSIFNAMLQEFDGAARILGLDPGIWKVLTHPKRQITVSCPVQMDNGQIEVFTGYRVQYNVSLGPAKGGIRYHPDVSLDEIRALIDGAVADPLRVDALVDVLRRADIDLDVRPASTGH